MEDNALKNFIKTAFTLLEVRNLVKEKFFLEKFNSKFFDFSENYIKSAIEEKKDNVAQYQILLERCLSEVDYLNDILREFKYLNLIKNTPLLLDAELNLLAIKLEITRKKRVIESTPTKEKEIEQNVVLRSSEPKRISRTKKYNDEDLNSTKQKILEYIKNYPNSRTKDIVFEFNALSDRTVKRNLGDLLKAGLIKKKIDNKAVYYYSS